MAQNDFFLERRHTRSFLQSFKWFQAILTSYHISHQTSHKPNHGLGLRQGWNSENFQKWVWLAQNDFFHERRPTRSFSQSFKWFKAILTSYHISHQTFPAHQIMDWDLDKGEILKTYNNEFDWPKTIFFHERRHTRSFLQSFKWFKAILSMVTCQNGFKSLETLQKWSHMPSFTKKIVLSCPNSFL